MLVKRVDNQLFFRLETHTNNIDYSEHRFQIMLEISLSLGVYKILKISPWRFEGDIFNEGDEGKSLKAAGQRGRLYRYAINV